MPPGITIVGLGPGGSDLWTEAARKILTSSREIWLRTARHPGVGSLREHGTAEIHSFDAWYEEAADFASLYERIADRILELGARDQGVVYAVPGSPTVGEATVARIRSRAAGGGLTVKLILGLSFVEPTLAALGIDGLDGLQIADASQLADRHHPPLDPDRQGNVEEGEELDLSPEEIEELRQLRLRN